MLLSNTLVTSAFQFYFPSLCFLRLFSGPAPVVWQIKEGGGWRIRSPSRQCLSFLRSPFPCVEFRGMRHAADTFILNVFISVSHGMERERKGGWRYLRNQVVRVYKVESFDIVLLVRLDWYRSRSYNNFIMLLVFGTRTESWAQNKVLREHRSNNGSAVVWRKAMEAAEACFSFISVTPRWQCSGKIAASGNRTINTSPFSSLQSLSFLLFLTFPPLCSFCSPSNRKSKRNCAARSKSCRQSRH